MGGIGPYLRNTLSNNFFHTTGVLVIHENPRNVLLHTYNTHLFYFIAKFDCIYYFA